MPEIKHTFIGGKMNKDLDERIVPNGEYRDASNIQVRTTDGDAAGTVQGIKGNTSIGSFTNATNPTTGAKTKTIGSVVDEKSDNIYFFMAAPPTSNISLPSVNETIVFSDSIIEQNIDGTTTPVLIDEHTIVTTPSKAFWKESGVYSDNFTSFVGSDADGWFWYEIIITDNYIASKLRVGTKIELFNISGDNLIPNAVVKNKYTDTNGKTRVVLYTGYTYGDIVNVNNPMTESTAVWVRFSNPRVLNFDYNKNITGINIIDNLLLWTDGSSEPKKINIDRCKAGTPPPEEQFEYIYNGDFEEIATNYDNGGYWSATQDLNFQSVATPGVYQANAEVEYLTGGDWNYNPSSPSSPFYGFWYVTGSVGFSTSTENSVNWSGTIEEDPYIGGPYPEDYAMSFNAYLGPADGLFRTQNFNIEPGTTYRLRVRYRMTTDYPVPLKLQLREVNPDGDNFITNISLNQNINSTTTSFEYDGEVVEYLDYTSQGSGICNFRFIGQGSNPASGYVYDVSFTTIVDPNVQLDGRMYLNGIQNWNNNDWNNQVNANGNLTYIMPEGTLEEGNYEFSFDYEIVSGTLKGTIWNAHPMGAFQWRHEFTLDTTDGTNGVGTYKVNLTYPDTAANGKVNIQFNGGDDAISAETAVYAYIDNLSMQNIIAPGYSHTKLYVSDPTDISSEAYVPITDLEVYDFEGDQIDDNLKEEHITVIRKAPTRAPDVTLNETDRGIGVSTVFIEDNSFITSDINSTTGELKINDIRIFNSEAFESTIWRINDLLDFTTEYVEITDGDEVSFSQEVKVVCKFISYMDENKQPTYESTNIIKIEVMIIESEYLDYSMTDWTVSLRQKEPLFELKLGRFAYRYKYEDGEYSSFGPWSKLAFLPGPFNYERKTGYNTGMQNNVREIIIKDFIPFKTIPLDVKSVDILYKQSNAANCYVVKTINRGVDSEWDLFTPNAIDPSQKLTGQLNITSEMIHSVLPDDQILRTWDNVPRYAKSQEITGNRLLFGNYVQSYDVQLPVGLSQEIVGKGVTGIGIPNKSIKSLRDYKWGMVFGDKYGRETPVFTSGYTTGHDDNYTTLTGDVTVGKSYSNTANSFKVTQNWENPINTNNAPPSWAEYVKYYVKEPSNEYYNLVLNSWYYADEEGDTVWLSFQSVDRQKVDEETYLILKSKNGYPESVIEDARYKIIAIESNAPDFIKTYHKDLGVLRIAPGNGTNYGNTESTIWSTGNAADPEDDGIVSNAQPDLFVTPGENGKVFSINENSWDGLFGVTGHDALGPKYGTKIKFRIIGKDGAGAKKYSRWNQINNWRYQNAVGIESGLLAQPTMFDIFYDEVFGEDADMYNRFLADESLGHDAAVGVTGLTYSLEFQEEEVENKPEFDGRFFVKVQVDNALRANALMVLEESQEYVPLGNFQISYIESESDSSAKMGEYSDLIWGWGEGDGWWHNAFTMADEWTDLENGGDPPWDQAQSSYSSAVTQSWATYQTANNNAQFFSRYTQIFGWKNWNFNNHPVTQMSSTGASYSTTTASNAVTSNVPTKKLIVPQSHTQTGYAVKYDNNYDYDGTYVGYSNTGWYYRNPIGNSYAAYNNDGDPERYIRGGLGTGFAYYAWRGPTADFWNARKTAYGGKPFLDRAAVAGIKGSGSNYSGSSGFRAIVIGEETNQRPTGLDLGSIPEALSTNLGLAGVTQPTTGLGRMCLAVTGYGTYQDIPDASHSTFMIKMGTVGTHFRFTGDPNSIYKVVRVEAYVNAANLNYWNWTGDDITVSGGTGNSVNNRIGWRVNFRKCNANGAVINEGVNVDVFDPRGTVRHDGTMDFGIELVRHAVLGGGQMAFETDNAVFETEPKDDLDLDIYYEGSDSIPLVLNDRNIHDFAPINIGISTERTIENAVHDVELSNELPLDIIKNPTHKVSNAIAKPLIFNDSFEETEGDFGVGDPIVQITGVDGNGNIVDQDNGIYIGDHVVFHHKNGTKTRSKVTGFFTKNTTTDSSSNILSTYYSPTTSIIGPIQANPDSTNWPQLITDGSNTWDPACGKFINTLTIFVNDMIEGATTDIVPGMQMIGWKYYDTIDDGALGTLLDEGIAPPGIVVVEAGTVDGVTNTVQIRVSSDTETPFYFQAGVEILDTTGSEDATADNYNPNYGSVIQAVGDPQTHAEFVANNNNTEGSGMGRKLLVEWVKPPTGYYSIDKNVWKYPVDLGWHNCYSYGNGVESNRIRDDFNALRIDNGVSVSTTFSGYGKENRSSGLIYSGLYNSTSEINNLNEFNMAHKITKDLNPSYGSIQRLKTRDTDLIVFTEDKVLKVLSSKDALFNADGNPQLTATERVLGQAIPFVGDYGISNNPESLAWDQYRMYFSDRQRGAVLRLSRDGLTPISSVGMKTWFRDNLKKTKEALGTFDVVSGEYNLTLIQEDKIAQEISRTTVSFSEESKGWVSFKTFIPEAGGSVSGSYITAKGNNIWQHYTNDSYNSFYGIDPSTNSEYESSVSVLFNDSPDIIKSFNSVNYEGSQSRVVKNDSDVNEFYNLENKKGWYVNSFETDKQSGTIPEFIEKEGKWFNKINGTTTTIDNLDTGEFTVQGIGNPITISGVYV